MTLQPISPLRREKQKISAKIRIEGTIGVYDMGVLLLRRLRG